jgi:NADH:ubiquinone oxidoreductase subunit 4 (subunit M)
MLNIKNLLILLLLLPLIGIVLLLFIPSADRVSLRLLSFRIACVTFLLSLLLWVKFQKNTGMFQFVTGTTWISFLNLNFNLGIDGISLFFIILTTLLITLCLLVSWDSIVFNIKEYLISFLLIEFFLIGVFCVLDLLLFYIFFESVLIPMFLIIGIWGSRERKIRAAYFFSCIHYLAQF